MTKLNLSDALIKLAERVNFASEEEGHAIRDAIRRDAGRITLKSPAKPKEPVAGETPPETPEE